MVQLVSSPGIARACSRGLAFSKNDAPFSGALSRHRTLTRIVPAHRSSQRRRVPSNNIYLRRVRSGCNEESKGGGSDTS